jgi:hypothetical protein
MASMANQPHTGAMSILEHNKLFAIFLIRVVHANVIFYAFGAVGKHYTIPLAYFYLHARAWFKLGQ